MNKYTIEQRKTMSQRLWDAIETRHGDKRGSPINPISERTGISNSLIGYYLNKDRMPNAWNLRALCEDLNVSADWLLGLSDVRERR